MSDNGQKLYIKDCDGNLKQWHPMEGATLVVSHKDQKGELGPNWDEYKTKAFTATTSIHGMRIVRLLKKIESEQRKYRNQLIAIAKNEQAYYKVFRCIRYGDKVPRKYMRKYGMVIKNLKKRYKGK